MIKKMVGPLKLQTDPHSLVDKVGDKVTQKDLNKIISAQLIHNVNFFNNYSPRKGVVRREEKTENLLYFMFNGKVRSKDLDSLS